MDVLPIIDHAVRLELEAAALYERIAARFREDRPFRDFWLGLSDDEREHAHKLGTWRNLLELTPESRRPEAEGFDDDLLALEKLLLESGKKADRVTTPDEAFGIALALEQSELDAIYTTLLQASPIKRFPDIDDTRRQELGRHHEALVREIRSRSKDERNLYEAELIAASE